MERHNSFRMGEAKENDVYKQELLDDDKAVDAAAKPAAGHAAARKGNVGSHSSGFTDFFLKPELLRAIQDCGLETRTNAWSSVPPKAS
ncbi:DEAD-box ATP-dependent RNA helicase 15-like [Triticum aestivum]|uniref:DEAD-box ATP-dependent RNA helicase 15-like n=1 Tax=Triticum aestivum TaxID=4565 RepID=UPI001D0037E1|nr:DEAD-box ATP-dependent RNA helicase 15-like [Triticum aestivum]XP_044424199.1 DEAD-box ATP-dependent RNA helicase 15-like [Triticum aestivum]XP_044429525.1 DEAD-box ATP-dependent RNA helicase 15-like [Triticum aestivum]XP_044446965.1 DEAD-box ATP-dependent RNA helicase 15-like [Triticum aestivum]